MSSAKRSAGGGGQNEGSPTITQDDAFEMLSSRRRRHVIHYLKQHEEPATLRDLVEQIAAWENGVSREEVTYEQRMRVYTALRQSHLPKLDDGDVVQFDADRGTIELTDAASDLEVYLDVVPHGDIPWSRYYAGLGLLCTGLVVALWSGLPPFSFVAPLFWTTVVTALFAISSLFHVRHDRRMRLGTGSPPDRSKTDDQ